MIPGKNLALDRPGLRSLKTVEDVVRWLIDLVKVLDENHATLVDHLINGGFRTEKWREVQATAADVTAGKADAVGQLMLQHSTDGITWNTIELSKAP